MCVCIQDKMGGDLCAQVGKTVCLGSGSVCVQVGRGLGAV